MSSYYIYRDPDRTEYSDFALNVQHVLDRNPNLEAVPIYQAVDQNLPEGTILKIIAWKIQRQYE